MDAVKTVTTAAQVLKAIPAKLRGKQVMNFTKTDFAKTYEAVGKTSGLIAETLPDAFIRRSEVYASNGKLSDAGKELVKGQLNLFGLKENATLSQVVEGVGNCVKALTGHIDKMKGCAKELTPLQKAAIKACDKFKSISLQDQIRVQSLIKEHPEMVKSLAAVKNAKGKRVFDDFSISHIFLNCGSVIKEKPQELYSTISNPQNIARFVNSKCPSVDVWEILCH